jgi:hypothetical protein
LLAGILDSFDDCISISNHNNNKRFINDLIFLIRSLGFHFERNENNNNVTEFQIFTNGTEFIPTSRQKIKTESLKKELFDRYPHKKSDLLKYKIHVEKLDIDDYFGFEIDGNRRFVLGDLSVTHNTVLSLNIIAKLKKKTFIIVHKEFLMNQWIERIQQFLPGARVGKIQGQIFDIDDKDIVIGMLQSLYMKE